MGRTPAIQFAPGAWRVPTAPANLINTFAFVGDDVVAFTHGPEIRGNAREAVRGFLRDKAGAR